MSRPSQTIVLAEDKRQQRWAVRFLRRAGYKTHEIRTVIAPSGRGSAEQWLRQQYPNAVKEYRRRAANNKTALIILTDADLNTVSARGRQLDAESLGEGVPARMGDEVIVHLIPKWSIETWILCLHGSLVKEDSSYREENGVDEYTSNAAGVFFDWSRLNAQIPDHCVSSLRTGIEEIRRLG